MAEEAEVVRENSRDLAQTVIEVVKGNRETVGGEVARQRVEILKKLEEMRSERQGQIEGLIEQVRLLYEGQRGVNELQARYLETVEEFSEGEKRYQETVIGLLREYNEGIKQIQMAIAANQERLEQLAKEQRGS